MSIPVLPSAAPVLDKKNNGPDNHEDRFVYLNGEIDDKQELADLQGAVKFAGQIGGPPELVDDIVFIQTGGGQSQYFKSAAFEPAGLIPAYVAKVQALDISKLKPSNPGLALQLNNLAQGASADSLTSLPAASLLALQGMSDASLQRLATLSETDFTGMRSLNPGTVSICQAVQPRGIAQLLASYVPPEQQLPGAPAHPFDQLDAGQIAALRVLSPNACALVETCPQQTLAVVARLSSGQVTELSSHDQLSLLRLKGPEQLQAQLTGEFKLGKLILTELMAWAEQHPGDLPYAAELQQQYRLNPQLLAQDLLAEPPKMPMIMLKKASADPQGLEEVISGETSVFKQSFARPEAFQNFCAALDRNLGYGRQRIRHHFEQALPLSQAQLNWIQDTGPTLVRRELSPKGQLYFDLLFQPRTR